MILKLLKKQESDGTLPCLMFMTGKYLLFPGPLIFNRN